MTVNAISSSPTSTTSLSQVAPTRQPEPSQQLNRAAEQQQAPIPQALPVSVPSVNTEGQKIGTRISTQA